MIYITFAIATLALAGVVYILLGPLKEIGAGMKKLGDGLGQVVAELKGYYSGR